jgi:Flp pilus assembly protein TadD
MSPRFPTAFGWAYYKKNGFTRAIPYLKGANEKVPDNPMRRYQLGIAYYKNGDKKFVRKELRKALELNPGFSRAEDGNDTLAK